jgi:hypothetical protein
MNITYVGSLLFFLLFSCSAAGAQKLSCEELADVLDVKSWRIPMPKDVRFEWSIEIVEYAPRKPFG